MNVAFNPFKLYTRAYKGLSPNSWYLSLVMLINRSGTMVIPFMTIYCTQKLHFSITEAGFILALFGLGSIAGAFMGGAVTDRYGFYEVQIGALLTGGLLFMLLGYQHTFVTLGTGTFILSICNEAFRPANSTAIACYSTAENKTRSYSLNRLAVNLGWAVGGAMGGFLASVNYQLLFWADGATNILAAFILLRVIPYASAKAVYRQQPVHKELSASAYQDKAYLVFILLVTLFAACFFQLFSMQPVFFKTQWHFNERFIGVLMAMNGIVITLVEMALIYNLEGKFHPLRYISIGVIITGVSFLLLNLLPAVAWAAVLSMIVASFGEIMSMPFMNAFWVERTTPANRGQYAALYTIAWASSQILAPAVGSQVVLHGGYTVLWWSVSGMCGLCAIGFAILHNRLVKPLVAGAGGLLV